MRRGRSSRLGPAANVGLRSNNVVCRTRETAVEFSSRRQASRPYGRGSVRETITVAIHDPGPSSRRIRRCAGVRPLSLRRPFSLLARTRGLSVLPSDVLVDSADRVRSMAWPGLWYGFYSGVRAGTRVDGVLREPRSRAVFGDEPGAARLVPARAATRADHLVEGLGEPECRIGAGDVRGIAALGRAVRRVGVCDWRESADCEHGATDSTRPFRSTVVRLGESGVERIGSGIVIIIELRNANPNHDALRGRNDELHASGHTRDCDWRSTQRG
jgi:hypothetical protein